MDSYTVMAKRQAHIFTPTQSETSFWKRNHLPLSEESRWGDLIPWTSASSLRRVLIAVTDRLMHELVPGSDVLYETQSGPSSLLPSSSQSFFSLSFTKCHKCTPLSIHSRLTAELICQAYLHYGCDKMLFLSKSEISISEPCCSLVHLEMPQDHQGPCDPQIQTPDTTVSSFYTLPAGSQDSHVWVAVTKQEILCESMKAFNR